MNHFSKPARTPDFHIDQLKKRGLEINDGEEVVIKSFIRSIGYFRLSGYFGPLQSERDRFKKGTKFDDILRLYKFDSKLRTLTFEAIEHVEVLLRTLLTDVYSLAYDSFWYLKEEHFIEKTKRIIVKECFIDEGQSVERNVPKEVSMFKTLKNEILNSVDKIEQSEFMRKFRDSYSSDSPIPSWMIMETISFGKLSRLFSLLKPSQEKRSISSLFNVVNYEYLVSWIHAFVVLRNICAHHSRLWNRKIGKDIKMPTRNKHRFLSDFSEDNIRKYYGVASCLLKIFQKSDSNFMNYFKTEFIKLISEYDIDETSMGFPSNYKADEIWNMEGI